jgi:hypothetical protein
MFDFDPITWGMLAFLLWAIIFLAVQSKRAKRKQEKLTQRFLHDEEDANAVQTQPLDDLDFYQPELEKLPAIDENDPHKIKRAAARKMIRFHEPVSNIELKKRYGRLQLENLAHFEENFDSYVRALVKWAQALHKDNKNADARRILEHTLELGSEFRDSYKILADIYKQAGDADKFQGLLAIAKAKNFRDPAIKENVLKHLSE